jgi:flagellin
MVINTNIAAKVSANNLMQSTTGLNASLARLSSGSKIVSPSDDPAGMAESMSLNAEIGQTSAANSNVSNAVSFMQTQDGYLQQVGTALDQMAQLAVQAQDGTKNSSQIADYNTEFQALGSYITSTAGKDFNGVSLFSGSTLSVTTDAGGTLASITNPTLGSGAYSTAVGSDVTNATDAATALTNVTAAITQLATDRATIGANVQQMTYTGTELGVLGNNLSAANSQISDVDVAQESTTYAKYQILVQSGTAMLAQANQSTQSVMKLLQ